MQKRGWEKSHFFLKVFSFGFFVCVDSRSCLVSFLRIKEPKNQCPLSQDHFSICFFRLSLCFSLSLSVYLSFSLKHTPSAEPTGLFFFCQFYFMYCPQPHFFPVLLSLSPARTSPVRLMFSSVNTSGVHITSHHIDVVSHQYFFLTWRRNVD